MPLVPGRHLGPYEIVSPLGAGGMGEVYEARDTRLGRTVAIKVLPEELARDPARRARLEREAKAVSQLAHPHVCTLHDVGEEDGVPFLVMERCEGETLAARLERGPLPLEDTLIYGAQIAEALAVAHRRGVTHRDLKPANVILTPTGVKLLDFGLARLAAGHGATGEDQPTLSMGAEEPLTDDGTVLGTYPYMAPEQVEGEEADSRSDIFALGAVLYEMATGRRAFDGDSAASVMASVLKEEPEPLSQVQPVAPPTLDHIVSRCLAKDPEERWQSAKDVELELRWIADGGSRTGLAASMDRRRKSRDRLAWGVALLLGILLLLGVVWSVFTDDFEARPNLTFTVAPPGDALHNGIPALSPDGRFLAFVAQEERQNQLWLRPLASLEMKALAGTEGAIQPFWSPDSDSLGFFADGELKRADLGSGEIRTLARARAPFGGSWSPGGFILFVDQEAGLLRIPASGGVPRQIEPFGDDGERTYFWPHLLPDGERFLFSSLRRGKGGGLYLCSIEGGPPRLLREAPHLSFISRTVVDPAGFLLFVGPSGRSGDSPSLLGHRFDADRGELIGDSFQVAERIYTTVPGRARFTVGPQGLLVIRAERNQELRQLAWLDPSGEIEATVGPNALWRGIDLSPDGTTIAAGRGQETGGWAVWLLDVRRGAPTRIASDAWGPVWSWDGQRLAFSRAVKGPPKPFVLNVAAGVEAQPVTSFPLVTQPTGWTPDDERLIVESLSAEGGLAVTPLEGGDPEPLLPGRPAARGGSVSPDGEWLAFASEDSGKWEIYVTGFPEPGRRWRVSTGGGWRARWAEDGKAIYYSEEGRVFRVPVESDGTFRPGNPVEVFAHPKLVDWDVAPDGRLLVVLPTGERIRPPLTVISDWRAAAGLY